MGNVRPIQLAFTQASLPWFSTDRTGRRRKKELTEAQHADGAKQCEEEYAASERTLRSCFENSKDSLKRGQNGAM